jgi:anti-sigma factor RsiW
MEAIDLTCREIVELVTDYLDERLPPDTRLAFEAHLNACPGCTIYLDQMRQTIRLTGALREEQLSPEVQRELIEAFRGWRNRTLA